MTSPILFAGWPGLLRTVLVGIAAYFFLLIVLRVSGKRTLAKMDAFDFIVTVALGSTLSSVILDKSVSPAEGLTALALLVCLQFAITWVSMRVAFVSRLVKAEPTLLAKDGQLLHEAMRRQRVTREEIEAAIRQHGKQGLDDVALVILETDGSMSVVSAGTSTGDTHDQSAP
jgi:uncharacterized membrane protein YcaP (DUF421 family)